MGSTGAQWSVFCHGSSSDVVVVVKVACTVLGARLNDSHLGEVWFNFFAILEERSEMISPCVCYILSLLCGLCVFLFMLKAFCILLLVFPFVCFTLKHFI